MKMKLVSKLLLAITLFISPAQADVQEVCMSPFGECHKVVMAYLDKAQSSVDLALYSLTLDEIADKIIETKNRGVYVRLIIDKVQEAVKGADDEKLEAAGIPVLRRAGMKGALMHHKFAIIDSTYILTGSYNWTQNGSFKNSENLLVINSTSTVREFKVEFETLWAPYK
jgi:cardiolipin hydrolase